MKSSIIAVKVLLAGMVMVAFFTGISWGATAAGTISYTGTKTGRIYITAEYLNPPAGQQNPTPQYRGIGSSIPNKLSIFTLNGLQAGTYTLRAFMDVSDSGLRHANDPATTDMSPIQVTIPTNSSIVTDVIITIADPAPVALTVPTEFMVIPSKNNTGAIISWKRPQDADQNEIPTSYTISWSSSSTGTPLVGSRTIVANESEKWLHNTAIAYYYQVTAKLDGGSASTGWSSPDPSLLLPGSRSISGTLTYSGITPTGPAFVAALPANNQGPPQAIAINSPSQNSTSFTIPNLPDGSYNLYAFLDMNNNGIDDAGDYRMMSGIGVPVTISGSNMIGVTVPLPTSDVSFTLATRHIFSGEPGSSSSGEGYTYELNIEPQHKAAIRAQITSGTGIYMPVDMGLWYEKGAMQLNIDNMLTAPSNYSFTIKFCYDDACTTNSATITYNGTPTYLQAPPLPTAPLGGVAYVATPQLQWLPPATTPAGYSLNVNSDQGYYFWTEGISSASTSYQDAGLTLPVNAASYYWTISAYDNSSPSNSVGYQAQFNTAQSAPVISGVSPASLNYGGTITIYGFNLGAATGITIGGVPAVSFTVINPNQIIAAVPQNFANHIITVTSPSGSGSSNILLGSGAPISLTGSVTDIYGVNLSGATIQLVGNPAVTAMTDVNGIFTISNLPNNLEFSLRTLKTGYQHTYTRTYISSQNISTPHAYVLRTPVQFSGLGVSAGKGALLARATDANGNNLAGATFTYGSQKGQTYTLKYYDSAAGTFTGSATDSSGLVLIPDASHGDLITLTPVKAGWLFQSKQGRGVLESVTSLGGINALQPSITNVSPTSGTVGSSVTITGYNFTPDATVSFNGASAIITGNTGSQLTVTVPNNATSGTITVTTSGITLNAGSFTVIPVSYTLSETIIGNGQINGTLACLSGTCNNTYTEGTLVSLSATESYGSVFVNWSGACTGTDKNTCSFTMTSDKSVTATFTIQDNARLNNDPTPYGTVLSAYNAATVSGTIIKLRDKAFPEALDADNETTVTLSGGYAADFGTTHTGVTSITSLIISLGSLTIDNLTIK